MTRDSSAELLGLHAVRILGFAESPVIAHRFGLEPAATEEFLGDAEARGWVQHASFAGLGGWSLTAVGRTENERLLREELLAAGVAAEIEAVHRAFLPLNGRLLRACTDWQLRRPDGGDRLVPNDHRDPAWDSAVLDELATLSRELEPLARRLSAALRRFDGYGRRFATSLGRAQGGDGSWIDRTDADSCHRVWCELHEDLIATLGIDRRHEGEPVLRR